jgi:hypothetical protein
MADENHIINFIKSKIDDFTSYDDFVVLATFGFIVLTNDEYKKYFNSYATKKVDDKNNAAASAATAAGNPKPADVQIEDLDDDDWEFDDKDEIFGFVSKYLLKTEADPSSVASATHITVDLKDIKFGDSFTISFNNSAQSDTTSIFDKAKTKENFEKNFVNLAQAFYETEFCVDISGVDNSVAINDYINYVNTLDKSKIQKSLRVLYYNGQAGLGAKLDKNDFSKFVEFQMMLSFNELKRKIDEINYNIKHQIIVVDDKKLTQKSIEEKILKQKEKDRNFRKNTTIIVVNDTINISSLVVLPNIRIIHIKKETPTPTKINTLTHQCDKIIPHNFDAEITKEQGTNKNITTILYDNDADLVAILKYAVLSNVVVFIESSTD